MMLLHPAMGVYACSPAVHWPALAATSADRYWTIITIIVFFSPPGNVNEWSYEYTLQQQKSVADNFCKTIAKYRYQYHRYFQREVSVSILVMIFASIISSLVTLMYTHVM